MGIDQTGDRRDPLRVDYLIGFLVEGVAHGFNDTVFYVDGVGLPKRILEVSSNQRADVLN